MLIMLLNISGVNVAMALLSFISMANELCFMENYFLCQTYMGKKLKQWEILQCLRMFVSVKFIRGVTVNPSHY